MTQKLSPNTEDNDITNTDLTIPILLILIRKKYNDVPKPTAPSTTICGISITLVLNGTRLVQILDRLKTRVRVDLP